MIFYEEKDKMTGADLIKLIESNPYLLDAGIKETIKLLLKKRLINPSTLIDAQVDILEYEKDKYKCHFIESDTCNWLLMNGNEEQKQFGKKRAMYNAQFNTNFPNNYKLTEEELEESRKWFKNMYGFIPEEE